MSEVARNSTSIGLLDDDGRTAEQDIVQGRTQNSGLYGPNLTHDIFWQLFLLVNTLLQLVTKHAPIKQYCILHHQPNLR